MKKNQSIDSYVLRKRSSNVFNYYMAFLGTVSARFLLATILIGVGANSANGYFSSEGHASKRKVIIINSAALFIAGLQLGANYQRISNFPSDFGTFSLFLGFIFPLFPVLFTGLILFWMINKKSKSFQNLI